MSYHPTCPGRIPWDKTEKRVDCGQPVERLKSGNYAALCKTCNELEYSVQWLARTKANDANMKALIAERGRWELAGHVFRAVADREHIDRRAGD